MLISLDSLHRGEKQHLECYDVDQRTPSTCQMRDYMPSDIPFLLRVKASSNQCCTFIIRFRMGGCRGRDCDANKINITFAEANSSFIFVLLRRQAAGIRSVSRVNRNRPNKTGGEMFILFLFGLTAISNAGNRILFSDRIAASTKSLLRHGCPEMHSSLR